MKYTIEFKKMPEFSGSAVNSTFDASKYPDSGVYIDNTNNLYFVNKLRSLVSFVGSDFYTLFSEADTVKVQGLGLTNSDLLKIIAVSQKPTLAKELS